MQNTVNISLLKNDIVCINARTYYFLADGSLSCYTRIHISLAKTKEREEKDSHHCNHCWLVAEDAIGGEKSDSECLVNIDFVDCGL